MPTSVLTIGGGGNSGVLGLSKGNVMLWLKGDFLTGGAALESSGKSGVLGRTGGDGAVTSSRGPVGAAGGVGGRGG